MMVGSGRRLWQASRLSRFFVVTTVFALFWPFLAAFVLLVALLFWPSTRVLTAWGVPFYSSFAIPITIYATLLAGRRTLVAPHREPH
jgi:CDP-diglyceride synthetase